MSCNFHDRPLKVSLYKGEVSFLHLTGAAECPYLPCYDYNGRGAQFECDRCKQIKEGAYWDRGSSGFYLMGDYWGRFRLNDRESFVCDACMWQHPEYIKQHGEIRGN